MEAGTTRSLFLTVSDHFFFPGTAATVNSIRHFHPAVDVVVVNNNRRGTGLNRAQKAFLVQRGVRVFDAQLFDQPGRWLGAWALKAYAAYDLTRNDRGSRVDVLVGIDSDCILCGPIHDVIHSASQTGQFYGGADNPVTYDDTYRPYGIVPPAVNGKCMSTSLYVCALTAENRRVLGRWATCCGNAAFLNPGHFDQGTLNAVLFQQRGPAGVTLLDNHLWSQHWCYWEDTIHAEEGTLVHARLQVPQRALHCGGPEKFWTRAHADRLSQYPSHTVNYAWFLSFLWSGEHWDWERSAEEYLPEGARHLVQDVWRLRREIADVNPSMLLPPNVQDHGRLGA